MERTINEKELLKQYQENGCVKSINKLIEFHYPLIRKICSDVGFVGSGIDLEDLVNEGVMSIYQAANRYDLKSNVKFMTFAKFWVRKYVKEYMCSNSHFMKVGRYPFWVLGKLKTELNKEGAVRDETIKRVAKENGMSAACLSELINAIDNSFSLDAIEHNCPEEEKFKIEEIKKELELACGSLSDAQKKIISYRYGLLGNFPHSLKETAKHMKKTSAATLEAEKRARKKMLNYLKTRGISGVETFFEKI